MLRLMMLTSKIQGYVLRVALSIKKCVKEQRDQDE